MRKPQPLPTWYLINYFDVNGIELGGTRIDECFYTDILFSGIINNETAIYKSDYKEIA